MSVEVALSFAPDSLSTAFNFVSSAFQFGFQSFLISASTSFQLSRSSLCFSTRSHRETHPAVSGRPARLPRAGSHLTVRAGLSALAPFTLAGAAAPASLRVAKVEADTFAAQNVTRPIVSVCFENHRRPNNRPWIVTTPGFMWCWRASTSVP